MILVVDDNALNRLVILEHLESEGCAVFQAASVREALALLEAEPEIQLVITDLRMPQLDGWQLVRELRQPRWCHIGVIVMSGFADRAAVSQAKELSVDGFLVKPVTGATLRQAVREARQGHPAPLVAEAVTMERLGIDAPQYRRLVVELADEVRAVLEQMQASTDHGESAEGDVETALANLGESCRLMGAERMHALLASRAPTAGTTTADVAAIRDALVALQRVLAARLAPSGDRTAPCAAAAVGAAS